MYKVYKTALIAIAALGLSAGSTQAAFVNGSISFSNGGLTIPGIPSESIVSELISITQGPPAVNGCTGDFTGGGGCDLGGPLAASDFTLAAPLGTLYQYGGYTFELTAVNQVVRDPLHVNTELGAIDLLGDELGFTVFGIVDDGAGGFDPTFFAGEWTSQGSCSGPGSPTSTCTSAPSASWSASLTALGREAPPIPEPGAVALLGVALAGLGLVRRRK